MSGTTARAITKDVTPKITWYEEEYKQLDELPFTDENDNPDTGTLTLSGAMDISNMFRDSLKHAFKLLAEKVNELEVEFGYYSTLDEVVQKTVLVRDDTIDVVGKYVNGEVHLEAEDRKE